MSRSRRGSQALQVALALPVLIGMTALVVDVGYARLVHSQVQVAADAAAHASVLELDGSTTGTNRAVTAAVSFAAQNDAEGRPVSITANDVTLGRYDANGSFVASADPTQITAVQVRAHYTTPGLGLAAAAFGSTGIDASALAGASRNAVADGDHDGIPDACDADDDNDGIEDACDSDDDGDGVSDAEDADHEDDADGIADDSHGEHGEHHDSDDDHDGLANRCDGDDDGDGISDDHEGGFHAAEDDHDRDGIDDADDNDDDNDGIDDADDNDDDNDGVRDSNDEDERDKDEREHEHEHDRDERVEACVSVHGEPRFR